VNYGTLGPGGACISGYTQVITASNAVGPTAYQCRQTP
jgi:hypothetical protein